MIRSVGTGGTGALTCHDQDPSLGTGRKQERSAVPSDFSPPACSQRSCTCSRQRPRSLPAGACSSSRLENRSASGACKKGANGSISAFRASHFCINIRAYFWLRHRDS